jgi:hypothetical protein
MPGKASPTKRTSDYRASETAFDSGSPVRDRSWRTVSTKSKGEEIWLDTREGIGFLARLARAVYLEGSDVIDGYFDAQRDTMPLRLHPIAAADPWSTHGRSVLAASSGVVNRSGAAASPPARAGAYHPGYREGPPDPASAHT